jgi:hypothetical protein
MVEDFQGLHDGRKYISPDGGNSQPSHGRYLLTHSRTHPVLPPRSNFSAPLPATIVQEIGCYGGDPSDAR